MSVWRTSASSHSKGDVLNSSIWMQAGFSPPEVKLTGLIHRRWTTVWSAGIIAAHESGS
jgi:hypothetical protein